VSRLFRLLALLAALQLLGGHWVVLQTAAWVGMTVEYSKTESLPEALSKTFDGQHPCKLCVAVKQGRSEEQNQAQIKIALKTEAILTAIVSAPSPAAILIKFPVVCPMVSLRTTAPPTPPPLA
jgi:hypothetical protein